MRLTIEPQALPNGVKTVPLQPHPDTRGIFTEVFRAQWGLGVFPLQWNAVRSEQNVLRGVHGHWRHGDYVVVLQGAITVGLQDLRRSSPTFGVAALMELQSRDPQGLIIPPGIAHGFFFPEPTLYIYAVSHYWDVADELGCRWDDPDLRIPWLCECPLLSPRDANLPNLATFTDALNNKLVENTR